MKLDPLSRAWVQRQLAGAPPLSQTQQDLISEAFAGALELTPKKRSTNESPGGGESTWGR